MNSAKELLGLKAKDLWWYAEHVADFNTVVNCVGGNDDRLIQQIHITNQLRMLSISRMFPLLSLYNSNHLH